VSAAVFVIRCAGAGALHTQSASNMTFNGRRVRSLKPFSRTRWVGQAVTISAAQEHMPALRLTLFSDGCAEHPFDVPASVTAAVEAASVASIDQSVPFLRLLAAVVALIEGNGAPLSSYIAVFPILADVVEVKTGSRSTAHWRIHFIRPNGWLRHSFAQLITLLDIDRIGQNWEGSNTSHISTLRWSLDTHFLELPAATRQALLRSISTRFGAFSDPMAALTFYLDGS